MDEPWQDTNRKMQLYKHEQRQNTDRKMNELWQDTIRKMQLYEREQRQKNAVLVRPRVHYVAACILKLAIGTDDFKNSPGNKLIIDRKGQADTDRLCSLLDSTHEQLDEAVMCNGDVDPSLFYNLDEEVCALKIFLPDLEDICPLECAVFAAYDSIKQLFPQNFEYR